MLILFMLFFVCVRGSSGIPRFFGGDIADDPPALSAGTPKLKFKIIDIGIQILVAAAGEVNHHNVGRLELLFI